MPVFVRLEIVLLIAGLAGSESADAVTAPPEPRVLLALRPETLPRDPKLKTQPGGQVYGVFPLAWCQELHGGRQFYTALGHKIEYYADPTFRRHLLGGIRWVLRQEVEIYQSDTRVEKTNRKELK